MPWCPKCKTEYRDNYKICTDCNEDLVSQLPKTKPPKEEYYALKPAFLVTFYDSTQVAMLGALLKDAGIPYFIKQSGTGSYNKIFMGYSILGEEIYVDRDSYEKAKEILDLYFKSDVEDYLFEDNYAEDDTSDIMNYKPENVQKSINSAKSKRVILARIMLALLIFYAISSVLISRLPF